MLNGKRTGDSCQVSKKRQNISKNYRSIALRIDQMSRILFPLAFAIFCACYWSYYYFLAVWVCNIRLLVLKCDALILTEKCILSLSSLDLHNLFNNHVERKILYKMKDWSVLKEKMIKYDFFVLQYLGTSFFYLVVFGLIYCYKDFLCVVFYLDKYVFKNMYDQIFFITRYL